MSAYNLVNGQHCSENHHLLTEVLKGDWEFKGIVMSDWVSVYSAEQAANNGLDLEMPQPVWFNDRLLAAIKEGKVSTATIDEKVKRHLRVRFEAGLFEHPSPIPDESVIQSDSHRQLALEMAQKSITLLKNDGVLPLAKDKVKTIALIGPSAKIARTGGGGSSAIQPWTSVSPSEGIASLLGDSVKITYAQGCDLDGFKTEPVPAECLKTPDGKSPGLLGEYFDNSHFQGKPAFARVDSIVDFNFGEKSPDPRIANAKDFSVRWTGTFVPQLNGLYRLAIASDDGSRLYLDDKLVVDDWGQHPETQRSCEVQLEAGKAYNVRIEYNQTGGNASMHFGWQNPNDNTKAPTIASAVAVAKNADVAIVCVGNTASLESEGADVADFKMAGPQDELVQAVTRANPNTIVVIYGGVPVSMQNWLASAKAVIAAFYPGQEGGTALAQIIFGEVNPSGKLPFSYIQERNQSPAFKGYKDPGLKVNYSEGVFVGYRFYDAHEIAPLFPFGFGLSYTSYEYSNLKTQKTGDRTCVVTIDIKNTGRFAGEETAQLYVAPGKCAVPRPVKELKGFAKVKLAPGETKTITLTLDERAFEYFHPEKKQWTLEPGSYDLLVGASSRDIRLKSSVKM